MNDLEESVSLAWEYRLQDGCYAVEGICYCEKPVAPELQSLNIYVPESLMGKKGAPCDDGAVTTPRGTVYAPAEIPIVFYNDIGGYAECKPARLRLRSSTSRQRFVGCAPTATSFRQETPIGSSRWAQVRAVP